MGYALPSPTDWVTCSWQCHTDRTPPSSEAGTDYGCSYGSPIYAVADGTVSYVKQTNSGAMGRVIEYRLDDGRTTRSLHLSAIWAVLGQRVLRGQTIAVAGASGYGDDYWYGPHDHQTLWPGAAWAAPTIDFALYVGSVDPGPAPLPPTYKTGGDDMETVVSAPNGVVVHLATGAKHNFASPDQYNLIRDTLKFLKDRKQADVMLLPQLKDVAKVDWDTFEALCAYFGVPSK